MIKRLLLLLLCFTSLAMAADQPLNPDVAFKFSAVALDARTIEARWQIAEGYYLYRNKFKFAIEPESAPIKLGEPKFPSGKVKDDEFFGKVEIYRNELKILLPIEATGNEAGVNPPASLILKVSSQGCADFGICYPPIPQQATVELPRLQSSTPSSPVTGARPNGADSNETFQVTHLLKNAGMWTILLFFFGSGLALAFTPCMLPMVPILSGIIIGHGHDISKTRAFVLSLTYVMGMALTYAVFGVAAGLSGTLISNSLQNAWVLGGFALIFVALSLSMFGFYELQLPTVLQSKFSEKANRQQAGSLHGVAVMGALSAIIVGPCVAAPLAGALLYIARSGDAMLGGGALFVMALGMGLPLILIGTSARHWLPKPGPWMEAVKQFFGVLLLALAIWLVTPVISGIAQMIAWATLLIFSAIYLHALDPLPPHAHGWLKFGKGLGVMALLLGIALLLGALGGSRDPLQPLGFLRGANASTQTQTVHFESVKSIADLESRLKHSKKPVMLDFYADWCVSCKEMERFTFSDPAIGSKLDKMLLLKADVTENTLDDQTLLKRFELFGPPGIIFFDAQGKETTALRVVGFQDATAFGRVLDSALAGR